MNKLAVLSLSAPLLLLGAAYPKLDKAGPVDVEAPDSVAMAPVSYRPCRPGPGDDHCIQLYERGVRASYARWTRHRGPTGRSAEVAMGGPDEPMMRRHHRRHHAAMRCDEDQGGDEARGM